MIREEGLAPERHGNSSLFWTQNTGSTEAEFVYRLKRILKSRVSTSSIPWVD